MTFGYFLWCAYWLGFFYMYDQVKKDFMYYPFENYEPDQKNVYSLIGTVMCLCWPVTLTWALYDVMNNNE